MGRFIQKTNGQYTSLHAPSPYNQTQFRPLSPYLYSLQPKAITRREVIRILRNNFVQNFAKLPVMLFLCEVYSAKLSGKFDEISFTKHSS